MSNLLKLTLNRAGVRKLMKSPEMLEICKELAYTAQNRLGDGYEVTYRTGKTRVNASISAKTYQARKKNLEENTILKALRG